MAIKTNILGMVHDYPDYFVIGREKIREYATAIKADDPATTTRRPPPHSATTRWSRRRPSSRRWRC